MKASIHLILLLTVLIASVTGNPDEQFIKDIIINYKLTSPTLIFGGEIPDIQWSPVIRAMLNSSALLIVQNWLGMERIDYS